MEPVFRAVAVYIVLWVVFRAIGRGTLSEISTFDLVLLIVISLATQQALLTDDLSFTNAVIVVATLGVLQALSSVMKRHAPDMRAHFDGGPVLLIERGVVKREVMERLRIEEMDILAAARRQRGLERLDQIKYAVLESSGGISIIAKDSV